MTIEWVNGLTAELLSVHGSDVSVVDAARISLSNDGGDVPHNEKVGLIQYLMKNRHGSPFEHNQLVYRLDMPIFIARELVRHRIGISWNEVSGRYVELAPRFYAPPADRPLVQEGKPGAYQYVSGSAGQWADVGQGFGAVVHGAWDTYQRLLSKGIAREVARMVLPVNIMTQVMWTCNLRSLMAVLSLRTEWREGNQFASYPQWEIARLADQLEEQAREHFPLSIAAFDQHGRVSP